MTFTAESKRAPLALRTTAETAIQLGTKEATLIHWRSTGRNTLPYIKVGRLVRYRQRDIDAWLDSQTRLHTGEVTV